jgi:hypothetical protein
VAKLVVVIPALDEAATVGSVVAAIPRSIAGVGRVEVVVVDDGSTDETRAVALAAGADAVVVHPRRRGLVKTFRDGVEEALRRGAGIVVTLDADGQHDPEQIPSLLAPILRGDADVALGVRPLAESADKMSPGRRWGNILGSRIASTVLGLRISDATSGYRAFTRDALMRMNVLSKYTYTLETLVQAAGQHLAVVEVPVPARERLVGKSRMTNSIVRYIRRTGGQAASAVARQHLVAILCRLALAAFVVAAVTTGWFLHGYGADGAGRHLPSLLGSLLSWMVVMGLLVSALLASSIDASRRLIEDGLYHLRCLELGRNEGGFAGERPAAVVERAALASVAEL